MRHTPRPRRHVPPSVLVALRPLFRYDPGRDAAILRVIGHRVGPVLRPRRKVQTASRE